MLVRALFPDGLWSCDFAFLTSASPRGIAIFQCPLRAFREVLLGPSRPDEILLNLSRIDSPFLFHWCGIQDPRGSTAATGPEAAHPQEIAFVPHPAPHHPLPKSRPRHLLGRASDPSGSATQTNPRPLASARREVVAAPGAVSLSGSRSPRSGGSWGEGCGRAEAVTLLEQLNW